MTRSQQRSLSLIALIGLALYFVYAGHQGTTIKSMPAQYAGYILLACGALGCFGVNIWIGGPFDPRKD